MLVYNKHLLFNIHGMDIKGKKKVIERMYLRIHSIWVTVVQSAPKFISDNINAYPSLLGGITTVGAQGRATWALSNCCAWRQSPHKRVVGRLVRITQ